MSTSTSGSKPERKRWPFVVGALWLTSCVGMVVLTIHLDKISEQLGPLGPACEGQAVAVAKLFDKSGPHAMTLLSRHATERWRADPNKTDAQQPEQIDVVICVDKEQKVPLGECAFYRKKFGLKIPGSDSRYTRSLSTMIVNVFAAKTGQKLGSGTIAGKPPIRCDQYSGKHPSDSSFAGDEPDMVQIRAWVDELIKTGKAPAPLPIEKQADDAAEGQAEGDGD